MAVRVLTTFEHRRAVFVHHHPEGVLHCQQHGREPEPPMACTLGVFIRSAAEQRRMALRTSVPFSMAQRIEQD